MDWFLYDNGLRFERVKGILLGYFILCSTNWFKFASTNHAILLEKNYSKFVKKTPKEREISILFVYLRL